MTTAIRQAMFHQMKRSIPYLVPATALAVVLVLHGAVPFVASPTLGQAVFQMGFSESFANDSILTVHSHYFGYPAPAALVFGLPLAHPAGFLIRVGVHAADAYAVMAAVWLSLAFSGAFLFARVFGLKPVLSALVAVLWMSLPLTWAHAGYSALSLGIALMPLYLFLACRVFALPQEAGRPRVMYYLAYVGICIISMFMDGYSFVMFAVGATLLGGYACLRFPGLRRYIAMSALPVHVVGLGIAVLLYIMYIGGSMHEPHQMDFFRGWGLDLTFLAIPTQGVHWLWDGLRLSVARSAEQFFGDASVWTTTFSLPLVVTGLLSWWMVRSKNRLALAFIVLALLGLYLAMGPSVKIAATKPEPMGPLMPAELALAPTGNAFLHEHVPGFNVMRAAYRWSALMVFSFWALLVLHIGALRERRNELLMAVVVIALVISNIPHIQSKWTGDVHNRESFYRIETDLVALMDHDLEEGELVAFLPYRNDFMVNYIAPRMRIRTYNVGGDKGLFAAREHWPDTMRQFKMAQVDGDFAGRVLLLLGRSEADAVVLPYIDMAWAAHSWPVPAEFKAELDPVVGELLASGFVTVQEREYYAVVRIAPSFHHLLEDGRLERLIRQVQCIPPECLGSRGWKLENMPREVGYYQDGSVYSDGNAGFMSYGPYIPMNAGEYQLVVRGVAPSVSSAWVDVVSAEGTVKHAEFALTPAGVEEGVLASGHVTLEQDVTDLEVRIWVGADDEVRLDGYELVRAGTAGSTSAEN